jgi:hypothetical protein
LIKGLKEAIPTIAVGWTPNELNANLTKAYSEVQGTKILVSLDGSNYDAHQHYVNLSLENTIIEETFTHIFNRTDLPVWLHD